MGFSYHELKRIKKNSIVLEKKENIEIQQNCTGFSRKKSTFLRERFFCTPTNSCRRKCNDHQKDKIKGKLSKQSVDIQKQLKDTLVLGKDLQEKLEEKVQNTCYQLANLEEDINHEIEKLQVGNDFLLKAFSGMEKNFCEKTKNKFNKEEKTWAEHLAHNSCGCKEKQQDHFDIAKERFSLQHQCISTSPRYGDDEHLAPRPRMRSVGSQVTTAIECLDQGALGDHKKFSNSSLKKKKNKTKDYMEQLTNGLQIYPQISEPDNFTVNCCSGMSQPPYCSCDVYSKVPPNGAGSYYYNCYEPEVLEGTPPDVYCRNEYHYDCTKCGSNSYNKRTCKSPSIKTPIRRQSTDLNTEFFCNYSKGGFELRTTTKDISHKNKNANKEKEYNERKFYKDRESNERKSRVIEKPKEQTTKRNRSNSKTKGDNKTAKGENLEKRKSEAIVKVLRNLDRYVDERDKELKLKRKQIANSYSSTPTTTTKVRSEAKLFQVMLCKKLSNAENELLLGCCDSLSLGSQYSAKTLQMLKQMKIREYKPVKPHEKIADDDTEDESRRQEKLKKYQQYCEKYRKECLEKKEPLKVLKEPEANFGERASHEMDLFKQQTDNLKDSSEGQEDLQEELQTVKEADYRNRKYNQDNHESSPNNDRKEKTNLGEAKTAEESPTYKKFTYEDDEAKSGLNGWNDYDRYRQPYNNGKYNRDFYEDGRDKAKIEGSFDYPDGKKYNRDFGEDAKAKIRIKKLFDNTEPDSANTVKDSLDQSQRPVKTQPAKMNAEELYSRQENGQRKGNGIDEESHRAKQRQGDYDKEANYYSPNEDSQLEMLRDANVVKREIQEAQLRRDMENDEIDVNSHRARQRPYKYDKEGKNYSPNEDSQFQMQRDVNVMKREIKEPQIRRDLENHKNDVNSHRAKQRPYKYDKEANYYSPNEDSQFQMQREANVIKREIQEPQIRKDLDKTKKNVNEFKRSFDEKGHCSKQGPYKYDEKANYYSPNEDSQFQMQRDVNIRKREIEEQQIRKDLEKDKNNVDEFKHLIDEKGHCSKQGPYKYDKEANYYSPNEYSQFQMQRDVNIRKREIEEQQIRKDLEKDKNNVDEFKHLIDEKGHCSKQGPYKYDQKANYYSPNEDSQFQMQREANVRKRELEEQRIRKDLENNQKNIDEFERTKDENSHRRKQRPYKNKKEASYYLPNEDSQFQLQRDANIRKREFKEHHIRKDLEKSIMTPAEETLHTPECSRQQKLSTNESLVQKEQGKGSKSKRYISRKQPQDVNEIKQEDIQNSRLPTNTPKTENKHKIKYEQDQEPTEASSPPLSLTLKKDKNLFKEIPYDEGVPSSYNDFKKVMDHNLGIYTHRSSQTESMSPTEPNDKYSQRTFSLEPDSEQTSLMPTTTEDALKYLNNFLQIYQQQTGMQQKCLTSVTTAAYNLIKKLSSCKIISPTPGKSEILESPKNVKEPIKSVEDKATFTALEEELTQDVLYKDPKSTPDASAAQFKQKFEEPIESGKTVVEATNENENFLSAKSNDQELEHPNLMKETTPKTFDSNLETNERFKDETYQSPDNLEFWDTVENYQRYQECKDDSLKSFAQQQPEFPSGQSPTYDTTYEPEYYETYAESPYRDLPTSSRQPIFDPDIMPAKGILKPYRVAENPQEEFCDFETYTSASVVSYDQKDNISAKQGFSITCSKGQESQEKLSNEEMEVFIGKEKYLNPMEEQSYLELEENTKHNNQSTYHDCQLDIKPELDNDSVLKPPPFKQCPCMWETYVKMMQNY